MRLFSSIMEKLGLGTASAMPPSPSSAPQASPAPQAPGPSPTAPVSPKGIKPIDVVAKLEWLAAAQKEKLNWKTSIELRCPALNMGDSAQMNLWLHKTVLQKLADNGGNIPKELL